MFDHNKLDRSPENDMNSLIYRYFTSDDLQELTDAEDLCYTGIDPEIFEDFAEDFACEPELVNEYFERFTGSDRIRHIRAAYPCPLEVAENNGAL